jgi:hypothetical protein
LPNGKRSWTVIGCLGMWWLEWQRWEEADAPHFSAHHYWWYCSW